MSDVPLYSESCAEMWGGGGTAMTEGMLARQKEGSIFDASSSPAGGQTLFRKRCSHRGKSRVHCQSIWYTNCYPPPLCNGRSLTGHWQTSQPSADTTPNREQGPEPGPGIGHFQVKPPWKQLRAKSIVSLVKSHSDATSRR